MKHNKKWAFKCNQVTYIYRFPKYIHGLQIIFKKNVWKWQQKNNMKYLKEIFMKLYDLVLPRLITCSKFI